MRYKMMGSIEQGICYTTFTEDVEDSNQQDVAKKEGTTKSHGSTNQKLDDKQSAVSNEGPVF